MRIPTRQRAHLHLQTQARDRAMKTRKLQIHLQARKQDQSTKIQSLQHLILIKVLPILALTRVRTLVQLLIQTQVMEAKAQIIRILIQILFHHPRGLRRRIHPMWPPLLSLSTVKRYHGFPRPRLHNLLPSQIRLSHSRLPS